MGKLHTVIKHIMSEGYYVNHGAHAPFGASVFIEDTELKIFDMSGAEMFLNVRVCLLGLGMANKM